MLPVTSEGPGIRRKWSCKRPGGAPRVDNHGGRRTQPSYASTPVSRPSLHLHNPGRPVSLRLGGLDVEAFSISGLSTYVLVPSFDACFDLGHCSVEASHLRHVLLSH